MTFKVHVWGPAFGLASIDPECLALITYLAYAGPHLKWSLVVSSPSAVPSHQLPALHNISTDSWTCGFSAIVDYITSYPLPQNINTPEDLTPSQISDSIAYATFLHAHAPPLLALSLYTSSANWTSTTRQTYSQILPFPLTWTEPPAVRAAMEAKAESLGLNSLDTDVTDEQINETGSFTIPRSLRMPRRPGVGDTLTPEQRARIRLDAITGECLSVLAELKGSKAGKRFLLSTDEDVESRTEKPTALDCLAFGYLALMAVPELPRSWLRETMRTRYECLSLYVDQIRDEVFGGDVESLQWEMQPASSGFAALSARFADGVARAVAGSFSDGMLRQRNYEAAEDRQANEGSMLLGVSTSIALLGLLAGGAWQYKRLQPFGQATYQWQKEQGRFGAAGAVLGIS